MRKLILEKAKNKRIVILGFGMEGQSSLGYLLSIQLANKILVADQNTEIIHHPLIRKNNIEVLSGEDYLSLLQKDDFILKSPGVQVKKFRPELFSHSQTSLFLEKFGSQIIGITGTKGKSTSSTMMYQILEEQNKEAFLVGNIGQPAFDMIPQIKERSWIVYELSAHQLQCVKQGPRMAILLNLMPEHLDYFASLEAYYQAKLQLFAHQRGDSFAFYHDKTKSKSPSSHFPTRRLSTQIKGEQIFLEEKAILTLSDLKYLLGHHHLENIQALIELSNFLHLDLTKTLDSIKNFHPLPHRQELLGDKNGIRFINDSISTIPQSAIQAIKASGEVDYLILGGLDRGIEYDELITFLSESKFKKVYFLGEAGKRMLEELKSLSHSMDFEYTQAANLQGIQNELLQIPRGTVLLSPAAASYDHFKNFEERGNYFRDIFSKI